MSRSFRRKKQRNRAANGICL